MFYLQSKPEQFIMFNGVNIAAQYMDGAGGKYGTGKTTKIVLIPDMAFWDI